MAKRKSRTRTGRDAKAQKRSVARSKSSSGKRPKAKARGARGTAAARKPQRTGSRKAAAKPRRRASSRSSPARKAAAAPTKVPKLDRVRRTLEDVVPTPPSSLNMDRRGSAARSGREEMADNLRKHGRITPGITGGDVDADFENAYFSGDEAPGGDNPTPDQDIVDDIGKALGVQYNDDEELKSGDKVSERDKHRWELDPASSEDYKERD